MASFSRFDLGVPLPRRESNLSGAGRWLPRQSALPSTAQGDQFNCLSILIIFVKQRTYLATLPNCLCATENKIMSPHCLLEGRKY